VNRLDTRTRHALRGEMLVHHLRRIARRAQRGMTLLEIMIVLAILALVMGLVVGPRVMRLLFKSKVSIAELTVNKLAHEAYAEWAQTHTNKLCPDKIDELTANMNTDDKNDPWGNAYVMLCGSSLPPGVKDAIGIKSLGKDGKDGTDDDITSWQN
jgi:general secretion pathway protein G